MEHKLITGGEQYLPFARSRIKAMRATGLMFASQQFEIDGCSIKVRIEGDHEFITLSGSPAEILSGIIRGGNVVEIPPPTGAPPGTRPTKKLRSYKPTQNAWEKVLREDPTKSPETFNDEKRLGQAEDQYAGLAASQYSGLMAKAVQVVMGQGKPVRYKYQWLTCHGIVKSADDKFWLVEISKTNGVIAMPLPFATKGQFANDTRDAVKECGAVFGGVPSGGTFPKPANLAAAITAGNVIRLATAEYMSAYFANNTFHPDLGWSFNNDGSEAHNTCYSGTPSGQEQVVSFHYKLDISIGAMNPHRSGNDPRAEGQATLSVVASGRLVTHQTYAETIPFLFAGGVTPSENQLTSPDYSGGDAPIFVCHIAGVLEVVRVAVVPQGTPIHEYWGDLTTHRNYSVSHEYAPGGRRVYAPRAATGSGDSTQVTDITTVSSTYITASYTFSSAIRYIHEESTIGGVLRRSETYTRNGRGVILWTGTIRDSYAFTSALPAAVTYIRHAYQVGNPDPATGGSTNVNYWASTQRNAPFGAPPGDYFSSLRGTRSHTTHGVDTAGNSTTVVIVDMDLVDDFRPVGAGVKKVNMECYLPDGVTLNIPDIEPYVTNGTGWEVINAVIRANCFGPNPQATFATYLKTLNQGSALAGVADPTPDLINFIGYI